MTIDLIRAQIDALDTQVLTLLRQRLDLAEQIGKLKLQQGLPIRQPQREQQLIQHIRQQAASLHIQPDCAEQIWHIICDESVRCQLSDSPS